MHEINYRTKKCTIAKDIFRKIDKNFPELKYGRRGPMVLNNCHIGQRKLLFSEIEFITLLSKTYDLKNILIVYIGAAAGFHLPILFNMFPELEYVLIDPNRFGFSRQGYTNSIHIINDFYTDETYLEINKINYKNKQIAVISDFRSEPTDEKTYLDMIKQQKWVIQLNSVAYILKIRFPYAKDSFEYKDYQYEINEKNVKIPKQNEGKFLYLSGRIYTQIYPPMRSSESRLIKIRKDLTSPFRLKYYDVIKYDAHLNYYNVIVRSACYRYKSSQIMKYHLLGFDDGYESAVEYYLVYKYIKSYKKDKPTNEKVIQFLYYLDNHYFRDKIICLFEYFESLAKSLHESDYTIEETDIDELYNRIKTSLKNQIQYFNRGNLLKQSEYKEQIKRAKNILEIIKEKRAKIIDYMS